MTAKLDAVRALSRRLTPEYLEEHGVLPLGVEEHVLRVGTWKTDVEPDVLYDLEALAGARAAGRPHPADPAGPPGRRPRLD
ncbi:MAG TPA: hypothetical protein VFS59_07700, partial [Gemmatimonadaceae bacterium]|nr:hypothetical protein [Gemmatimonadaceae bacterium]